MRNSKFNQNANTEEATMLLMENREILFGHQTEKNRNKNRYDRKLDDKKKRRIKGGR